MVWLPYRLTKMLPTGPRLRKAWYASFVFRGQRELKRRWVVASRLSAEPTYLDRRPTVSLCRIIGNDLFPRHERGQALANLLVGASSLSLIASWIPAWSKRLLR